MPDLSPSRAYARLVALATLLPPSEELRAREAATVLVDAATAAAVHDRAA